jgi:hypothetical protein
LDLAVVGVLWTGALYSRSALGWWAASGVWLAVGTLVALVLRGARRTKMPSKQKKAGDAKRLGSPMKQLWEGWQGFAVEMGSFQARILLACFYFVVITPFAILVRLFSDPLWTKISNPSTFWHSHPVTSDDLEEAKRQF